MVVMGCIIAPHGIQGWVKIKTFTQQPDALVDYPTWWLADPAGWREASPAETRLTANGLIARLEGVTDRSAAEALKGREIGVPREALPEPGDQEYYWSDLIGLEVRNLQGHALGKVDHLLETGANDVLVVKDGLERQERLIPFIAPVIVKVDMAAGYVEVDWGLDY